MFYYTIFIHSALSIVLFLNAIFPNHFKHFKHLHNVTVTT